MKAPLWSSIIWYYYLFPSGLAHEVANPQSRGEEEEIGSDSFWVLDDGDGGKEGIGSAASGIHSARKTTAFSVMSISCTIIHIFTSALEFSGTKIQQHSWWPLTSELITYFNETKYTSRCQCWTAGPFYLRGSTYLYPEYCGRTWQETFLHFFQHYLI